jgi:hypothetical protein
MKARWCEEAVVFRRSIASRGDVERRVHADGHLGAEEVVVDGRGHADHGKAHLRKGVGARLRAVAADDDQRVHAPLPQLAHRLAAAGVRLELRAAGAAQHRAAALNDAAHVAGAHGREVAGDKAREAVANAQHVPTVLDPRAHHGANGGVHAGGIAPAGQNGDASHSSVHLAAR